MCFARVGVAVRRKGCVGWVTVRVRTGTTISTVGVRVKVRLTWVRVCVCVWVATAMTLDEQRAITTKNNGSAVERVVLVK